MARPTRTTRPPMTLATRRTIGTASTCRSTPGRAGAWCVQGGTSTGRGVNDTCDMYDGTVRAADGAHARDGCGTRSSPRASLTVSAPATLTEPWLTSVRGLGSYTVPKVDVLVSAIFRSQANAQPGADRGHERRVADRNLSHDRRAVPGRNGTTAGYRVGHAGRGPPAAGSGVRRPHQRRWTCASRRSCGSARRERTWAWTCTTCSTQHADDVRDGVRPGDERGAMDAAHGGAAAAVHAVQRAVRLLIVAGVRGIGESPSASARMANAEAVSDAIDLALAGQSRSGRIRVRDSASGRC